MNTERRNNRRYPVQLALTYVGRSISGTGFSIDVSSKGASILTGQRVPAGTRLELKMAWPFLLNGAIGLQFVAECKVVRVTDAGFAVAFEKHQFRTVRAQAPVVMMPQAVNL